jgi:hypothetical protein
MPAASDSLCTLCSVGLVLPSDSLAADLSSAMPCCNAWCSCMCICSSYAWNMMVQMQQFAVGFYFAALPAFFVLLCRRRMREEMAGYSDEETEDVTFRRLMTAQSATRELHGPGPIEYQDSDAAGRHKPPEANHHGYAASCRPATWLSAFCTACAACAACTACAMYCLCYVWSRLPTAHRQRPSSPASPILLPCRRLVAILPIDS